MFVNAIMRGGETAIQLIPDSSAPFFDSLPTARGYIDLERHHPSPKPCEAERLVDRCRFSVLRVIHVFNVSPFFSRLQIPYHGLAACLVGGNMVPCHDLEWLSDKEIVENEDSRVRQRRGVDDR